MKHVIRDAMRSYLNFTITKWQKVLIFLLKMRKWKFIESKSVTQDIWLLAVVLRFVSDFNTKQTRTSTSFILSNFTLRSKALSYHPGSDSIKNIY